VECLIEIKRLNGLQEGKFFDGYIDKQPNNTWILKPTLVGTREDQVPKKGFLRPGEIIELDITNITSHHPSGQTQLTIRYEEVPNYWDGYLSCIIYPSVKLDVNGDIRASSVYNTSDQRLKQDIEPVSNMLEKVMELQPKSYRWLNSESDSGKLLGFLAQDVEPVFPDSVDNKSDFKALNYNDFSVMAIAAIQEQQKLIDALQEEVAQLKQ